MTSTPPTIPQRDLRAAFTAHASDLEEAVLRVLRSGWYVLGPEVEAFESEFAAWLGTTHAVGVGSGTAALELSLRALGVGPGEYVVTVSHTAVATVAAIELCGAQAVLVDVDHVTATMDPARLDSALDRYPTARAIVVVHLYGHPARMADILDIARRRGIPVVEDCAQAHGAALGSARVGTLGDVAAFSFYPTKNLGGIGDGGMVVTDSPVLAEGVRDLRQYGWRDRFVSAIPGTNSRLDEMQAAALRVGLRHLDEGNRRRSEIAGRYEAGLAATAVDRPTVAPNATHAWHQYVVRTEARDLLRDHLRALGIGTAVHYPVPIHLQPAYRGRVGDLALPVTERLAGRILSMPMYPELSDEAADAVVDAVRRWAS